MAEKVKLKDSNGIVKEYEVVDGKLQEVPGGIGGSGVLILVLIAIAALIAPFISLKYLPGWGIALFFLCLSAMVFTLANNVYRLIKNNGQNKTVPILYSSFIIFAIIYVIYSISIFVTKGGNSEEYLSKTNTLVSPLIVFMILTLIFVILFLILNLIFDKKYFSKFNKNSIVSIVILPVLCLSILLTGCIGSSKNDRNDAVTNTVDFELVSADSYSDGVSLKYLITNYTNENFGTLSKINMKVYNNSKIVCNGVFSNVKAPFKLTYGDSFYHTFSFYYSNGGADQTFWLTSSNANLTTKTSVSYF